jgi:hypothetical protein
LNDTPACAPRGARHSERARPIGCDRAGEQTMAFTLNQPIGTNYRADPDDIMNTKLGLNQLGYYKVPGHRGIDDWTDDAMFDGIRSFQKANGLKADAFMRPDGPTAKAVNQQVQLAGNPQDEGWQYERDVEIGGNSEFDAKGPIRIDTHNPSVGTPAPQYHLDWHTLDENGKVIPEFRNEGTPPTPLGRHLLPLERREKVYEPPNQSSNGHRVRIWSPPQSETSNFPGDPYFKVYRKK